MTITVRRIALGDAEMYQKIRLRSLRTDPWAFGSTIEREEAFPQEEWERRVINASSSLKDSMFFAFDNGEDDNNTNDEKEVQREPCGLIGCLQDAKFPSFGRVVSMWVAPEARRKGVGKLLMESIAQIAKEQGKTRLCLDVVENNIAGIEFYEKCGFYFSGEEETYPNDKELKQREMWRDL